MTNPQLRKELEKVMKDMHATTHMPDCAEHCDGDERFLDELEVLVALQADKAVQDARIDELQKVQEMLELVPASQEGQFYSTGVQDRIAELKGGSDE